MINIWGGPGAGKSTVAAGLFYKMKVQGSVVELVTEYAKDLNYDDAMAGMVDQQPFIFAEQNRRQHRLRKHVDFAITDSPIILGMVYGHSEGFTSTHFYEYAIETFKTYDNVNIFLQRNHDYQTGGRYHNEDEAIRIDSDIAKLLVGEQIPYNNVKIGPYAIAQVLEIVNHFT